MVDCLEQAESTKIANSSCFYRASVYKKINYPHITVV